MLIGGVTTTVKVAHLGYATVDMFVRAYYAVSAAPCKSTCDLDLRADCLSRLMVSPWRRSLDETDGPTIGGRPILSIGTVESWFSEAGLESPSDRFLFPIVQAINHLDLMQNIWKDNPELRKWRENSPSRVSVIGVAKAVDKICTELPNLINKSEDLVHGDYGKYKQLVSTAQLCLPALETSLVKRKGRAPDNWHSVARNLKVLFKEAAQTKNERIIGFSQLTGTGIPLLRSALLHLGLDKTDEQIVDALRKPRKRDRRGK